MRQHSIKRADWPKLLGERQEAQILKFNAPPLHTQFVMAIL